MTDWYINWHSFSSAKLVLYRVWHRKDDASLVKQKFLSVKEKILIIESTEKLKLSVRQAVEKFKVGKGQVGKILKKKEGSLSPKMKLST